MKLSKFKFFKIASVLCIVFLWGWWFSGYKKIDNAFLNIPIQLVIVSDDDGQRKAHTTAQEFEQWVEFSNQTFKKANIHFDFSMANASVLKSTLMNNVMGVSDENWLQAKQFGNKVAAKFPGSVLVFSRYGPDHKPTGAGFSWSDYDFVVMPGFANDWHCKHRHIDALAHEIGHYFGLSHTFTQVFKTKSELKAHFKLNKGSPNAFDGDGLADTLPDPLIRSLECAQTEKIDLGGHLFQLPRRNIMSYYDERDQISLMQVKRIRHILKNRSLGTLAIKVK